MKKYFCLLTLFVALSTTVLGEIVETAHFNEILKYVEDDSLVILDIDDTLLIPVQTLGTDVWFVARLKYYENIGTKSWALNKIVSEWEGVRQLTKVKIVEEGTAEIIEKMQQNVKVMALTTQGLALSTCTPNQLKNLNIDMTKAAPAIEDHYFMNGQGVLYHQGILFTCGTPKGPALLKLFERLQITPKHVVFINDKATHLKDVEVSLLAENIRFTGLRYSYSDERVSNYNPEIAKIQWEKSSFAHILSDEEAEAYLQPRCL